MSRIVIRKKLVGLPEQVWKQLKEQGYPIPDNDYDLKRVNFKQYLKKLSDSAKKTLARILLTDLGVNMDRLIGDCEDDKNMVILHSIVHNQTVDKPVEIEQ